MIDNEPTTDMDIVVKPEEKSEKYERVEESPVTKITTILPDGTLNSGNKRLTYTLIIFLLKVNRCAKSVTYL